MFSDSSTDIYGIIKELYNNVAAFDSQDTGVLTSDDLVQYNIYKLALNYIVRKSKNLDKKRLQEEHNISSRELEESCQN